MRDRERLALAEVHGSWWLIGGHAVELDAANASLGYLLDRNYSWRTIRTYGYGLLAFFRWLGSCGLRAEDAATDDVLAFLNSCRHETIRGRPGPNVMDFWTAAAPTGWRRRR